MGTLSYAQVLAKNTESNLIPRGADRRPDRESYFGQARTETTTLYKQEGLDDQMQTYRAERIMQRALDPRSVLLELPTRSFKDLIDMYSYIQGKLGNIVGVTPVQEDFRRRETALLNVVFRDTEATQAALQKGIEVDGITIKATAGIAESGTPMKLTRVYLSRIPIAADDQELMVGLCESMAVYGKVVEIKKIHRMGFFEGQASVLLDTSDDEDAKDLEPYVPLDRMVYLSYWDVMAFASYKGAKEICYYCRQEGHKRAACPIRAEIICRRCHGKGHIARECRSEWEERPTVGTKRILSRKSEETLQPESKKSNVGKDQQNTPEMTATDTAEHAEKALNEQNADKMVEDDPFEDDPFADSSSAASVEMDTTDDRLPSKTEEKPSFGLSGTMASKHAPYAVSTSMKVDSAGEMEDHMDATPTVAQAKLKTTRNHIKPPVTQPEPDSDITPRQ